MNEFYGKTLFNYLKLIRVAICMRHASFVFILYMSTLPVVECDLFLIFNNNKRTCMGKNRRLGFFLKVLL